MGRGSLIGNSEANEFHGMGGNDQIDGGIGDDVLDGGADDDRLSGGLGDDLIDGSDGCDEAEGGYGDDQIVNCESIDGSKPVYRFWSPLVSHHFYTMDEAERDKLINYWSHAWTYEGIAFYAYADDTKEGVEAVYRFWSPVTSSYFYTMDVAERDKLINNYAGVWIYEGIAYYTYGNASAADVAPVYRFWSPVAGGHFYTTDVPERDKLINNYVGVWIYEGIAYYTGSQSQQPMAGTPVYQFSSKRFGYHVYTTSQDEKDELLEVYPSAWTYEGVAWQVYSV